MTAPWDGSGFHGKLPARGDFVTRRVPADVTAALDGWLQDSIAASRAELGGGWLERYLVSPVWHFALDPGLCGAGALTGLMIPSVDKVGRYFPLLLLRRLDETAGLVAAALAAARWHGEGEAAALTALDEGCAFDDFDHAVARLDGSGDGGGGDDGGGVLPVPYRAAAAMAEQWVRARVTRASLWWTDGADGIAPVMLATEGMPAPEHFARFLDGNWARFDGAAVLPVPLPEAG